MNKFHWIQKRRRSILFLFFALSLGGLAASFKLPVSLFPSVDFPRIQVNLEAGDRPQDLMAIQVTRPIEEGLRALEGVRNVRSVTSRGNAEISINFDWGTDMVAAQLQVESVVNQSRHILPHDTAFHVRRMLPTVFPILGYSLVSDTRPLTDLRDLALFQVRPFLTKLPGVAGIEVLGGETAEYHIIVDQSKLRAFGLTLHSIAQALTAANVVTSAGRIEDNNQLYLVISDTRLHDAGEIENTVIGSGSNGLILVEDLATVSRGAAPQWTRVTADGHDAVLFQVNQQIGGNTVEIARQIAVKFPELRKLLPPDVRIATWYDQSELIIDSGLSVAHSVLFGVIAASFILLLFLKNLRVTLAALLTLPAVLCATALLLFVFNMSFNVMTLGGMAAAVGLIIDDAIVVIEHIVRRFQDETGAKSERLLTAVAEIAQPLLGSSISTIIIFAPLTFVSGVTGSFFKALSITMAASLIISFLAAWLAAPLLVSGLLRGKDLEAIAAGNADGWLRRAYGGLMRPLLAHPWLTLGVIIPFLALGWQSYKQIGSGFLPKMDEGGFILDYKSAAGTSLAETDRLLRQVETILQDTPEVMTYSRRTGLQLGGGLTEANDGDFFIRLKPLPRRDISAIMDETRERIERSIPGLQIEMALLMEDLIGDLTAVPQPVEIKLFSDDQPTLLELAPKIAEAIGKIPGVVDIEDGIILAGNAVTVNVNRDKARLEGIAPDSITNILNDNLLGVTASQVQQSQKMIDLRVWIPQEGRDRIRNLENLQLQAPDGHWFPLKRVAETRVLTGQPQIVHDDLKQMIAVTSRISGRDLGSVIADIVAALANPGLLPAGVYYELGGLYKQQQMAFHDLLWVLLAAIALVFVLLLLLYESFRTALCMLFTTLLAAAAVFTGLRFTHMELNVTAMMGMTMVIGIATEAAIFYYSEFRELPTHSGLQERLIQAGKNRMRPIAMTTLAAILALLPLALGNGPGAQMQQPLAIAIISGLAMQLPLVLTIFPALLTLTGESAATNGNASSQRQSQAARDPENALAPSGSLQD